MAAVTIRNVPDETHRALKARAARNGRSTEAEIREILQLAVAPADALPLGDRLAALAAPFGGIDLDDVRGSQEARGADLS